MTDGGSPDAIALRDLDESDAAAAGGKALNLARLARRGLPVPRGFCVTAPASCAHASRGDLPAHRARLLTELASADPERRRSLLAAFRRALTIEPLDPRLAALIDDRARDLGPRLAVRSSATAEDSAEHSSAGQYDSFLDVRPGAECHDRILACWASLWTERAFEYRTARGIAHDGVAMAVIVQTLVDADAAGVLFTRDPATGRAGSVIIEGARGLGDAVVGGTVEPDRLVVAMPRGRVVERTVAAAAGDPEAVACLDDATAVRLARLALDAERALRAPLDIEWTLAGDTLAIVQARPITTIPVRTWADRQVWTNANAGEVLPDVVTPMTLSLVEPLVLRLFRTFGAWFGADFEQAPIIGLVAGRVYFNLNTLLGFVRCVPGLRSEEIGSMLGGAQGSTVSLASLDIDKDDIPDLRISMVDAVLHAPRLLASFFTHAPGNATRYLERMRRETDADWPDDWRSLSDADLVRRARFHTDHVVPDTEAFVYMTVGLVQTAGLFGACRLLFGADGEALASRLLAGLGSLDNAEAGLDLWRLSRRAGRHPEVARAVRDARSAATFRRMISERPGGADFDAAWERFTREHGHHTRGEIELANARWSECPDEMLALVRSYLDGGDAGDPIARCARLAAERGELVRDCRRRLGGRLDTPLRRALFAFALRRAHRGSPVRENLKSEVVRRLARVRAMVLEIGTRLTAAGVLAARDDVFFLRFEEGLEALASVASGHPGDAGGTGGTGGGRAGAADLRDRTDRRRHRHERNLRITPPGVVVGCFDPARFEPDPVDHDVTRLDGLAVSPGVARGPARVILRAGTDQVRPGEILVAPFTDPGWSPYFLNAAAIVMDLGGLLSHGSIIAREYGLPCVVNVGPATRIIRNGQLLEVDGTRGRVTIVDEPAVSGSRAPGHADRP